MARYELTGQERKVGNALVAERSASGKREEKEITFKYWGPKTTADAAALFAGGGTEPEMLDPPTLMEALSIGLDLKWRGKLFPSAGVAETGVQKFRGANGQDHVLDLVACTLDEKPVPLGKIIARINAALDDGDLGQRVPKAVAFAFTELVKIGKAREKDGRLTGIK